MTAKKFSLDDKTLEAYNSEKELMKDLSDLLAKHKEMDSSRMAVTLLDIAHDLLLTEKGPYQALIIACGVLHGFSHRGTLFNMEQLN